MLADTYDQIDHLILDCYGCPPDLLDNIKIVEMAMLETAEKIKAHVLRSDFHKFAPQGVSGILLIAESHLSIHTWPERGYAAIDVFTCGNHTLTHLAPAHIEMCFRVKTMKIRRLERDVWGN